MEFSICVDAIFADQDVYESIERLAMNGIRNIEFWSWWDKDVNRLVELKEKYGITYIAFCSKFFSMVKPEEREAYIEGFRETCAVANRLGCTRIITKPLDAIQEPFETQYDRMKELLAFCVKIAEEHGITIVLEPVNSVYEAPHTFLDNSDLAFRFVEEIGEPNLKVLYDIYHMQIDEGNVLKRILNHIGQIGHIHTAGSQERHELSDGELNYDYIFRKIMETDYDGYIGLEYFPSKDPLEGIIEVVRNPEYISGETTGGEKNE